MYRHPAPACCCRTTPGSRRARCFWLRQLGCEGSPPASAFPRPLRGGKEGERCRATTPCSRCHISLGIWRPHGRGDACCSTLLSSQDTAPASLRAEWTIRPGSVTPTPGFRERNEQLRGDRPFLSRDGRGPTRERDGEGHIRRARLATLTGPPPRGPASPVLEVQDRARPYAPTLPASRAGAVLVLVADEPTMRRPPSPPHRGGRAGRSLARGRVRGLA